MTSTKIPDGCFTMDQAASEIGVSTRRLMKELRRQNWLYIDRKGDFKSALHNTPKPTAMNAGYLKAFQCTYVLKGPVKVEKHHMKPVLTRKGLETMEGIIKRGEKPPTITPTTQAQSANRQAEKPRSNRAVLDPEEQRQKMQTLLSLL